jgi:membrane-associated phospholipid phosphatase
MNLTKRFLLVLLIVAAQSLYTFTNRTMHGGLLPRTFLDNYIPLWLIWVVPYLLVLTVWIGFSLLAAWKMDERPAVTGVDWASTLLRFLYANDRANNAFPSGHMYFAVLLAYFVTRWKPRLLWFAVLRVILVVCSTLFTRQHYVLDLVGGALFATVGISIGMWWQYQRPGRWQVLGNFE